MAGPLTIQRLPRGLLDLLLMKGSGEAPTELAAEIRASVDIGALYLIDKQETIIGSTNVLGAVGFYGVGTPLTVPDREMWLLTHVSVLSNAMIAGDTIAGRACVARAPFTAGFFELGPFSTLTGAGQFGAQWDFNPYRLLRSQDTIGFYLNQRVAYVQAVQLQATFYRLSI